MANDPRKPSWKKPTGGTSKNPAPTRKRDWQAAAGAPKKPASTSRRRRLLLTAIAGALLIAAIVVVIKLWSMPRYPLLVVVGPDNAGTLAAPLNVAGNKAAKDLADWAGKDSDRPRLAELKDDDWTIALADR